MKIIKLEDIKGTWKEVHCPKGGFVSNRYLFESDNMGYTLTRTEIPKGGWQRWCYKEHLETCLCISGHGVINGVLSGEYHNIYPGIAYVLDNHDDHRFKAIEDTVLICVFNPPLFGAEVHQEDGSYKTQSSYSKNAIHRLLR